MGSIEETPAIGIITYCTPASDEGFEKRQMFEFPPNTSTEDRYIPLRDMRTDPNFVPGPKGLDVQGFTYVNHHSALADGNRWFEDGAIEKEYIAEVEELLRKTIGAKRVIANNIIIRRKPTKQAEETKEMTNFAKKGGEAKANISLMPRDQCSILGMDIDRSFAPAPTVHCDYTRWGIREFLKYSRITIIDAAKDILAQEDADGNLPTEKGRYAGFSVWRPLKTVHRDPLVLCDARTSVPSDLQNARHRAPSPVAPNGEYITSTAIGVPPKEHDRHQWYWLPQQTQDEVLIIKHVDTASDLDESIAKHCLHVGARQEGTDSAEVRESMEARMIAFW